MNERPQFLKKQDPSPRHPPRDVWKDLEPDDGVGRRRLVAFCVGLAVIAGTALLAGAAVWLASTMGMLSGAR